MTFSSDDINPLDQPSISGVPINSQQSHDDNKKQAASLFYSTGKQLETEILDPLKTAYNQKFITPSTQNTVDKQALQAIVQEDLPEIIGVIKKVGHLIESVQNQANLTEAQQNQLKQWHELLATLTSRLQSNLSTLDDSLKIQGSVLRELQAFSQKLTPPESDDINAWKDYFQSTSSGLKQMDEEFANLAEAANKQGIDVTSKVALLNRGLVLKQDEPYTGIGGEIAHWILGNLMNEIYGKVQQFQDSISRNAAFLNVFGPMQVCEESWENRLQFHLPPTPYSHTQYAKMWKKFVNSIILAINTTAVNQWKAKMKAYTAQLHAIAYKNPPNQKLISMLKGIKAKFSVESQTLDKFLQAKGNNNLRNTSIMMYYFFTVRTDGWHGNILKSGMRKRMEEFVSKIDQFGKLLKDDGGSVQSTNTTNQSQLQLQLNFMQEFMQVGPTLIQTLNELAKAIAANLKGQ